jgi:hypothetical protein
MKTLKIVLLFTFALTALGGCASQSMLPRSANDVSFDGGTEGKVGWSSYRENATFVGVTKAQVIEAAKAGLGDADFALTRVDREAGVVSGEHGMTLHDWNIVAGVYAKEQGDKVLTVVIAEGSKDIGFSGDVTGSGWTGKILKGMREYLKKLQ